MDIRDGGVLFQVGELSAEGMIRERRRRETSFFWGGRVPGACSPGTF